MAGRFTVEAVFKGVDEMSAPIRRMSGALNRFTVRAEAGLRGLDRGINRMGSAIKGGLTAGFVAVTAAATAFGLALKGVADNADELLKQSVRLDFPIEQLQQWRFIAEQSGLTAEEFGSGLDKLSKGVGLARLGTGPLVSTLKKLNPALLKQVTNAKSVAEANDLIVKAIREAPDAMTRATLATAAYGKAGAKFIGIATQSEEALAALRLEATQNGLITEEQARAAEQFNDAFDSLKRAAVGFLQQAILPLLPMLTELIGRFREWTIANRELVSGRIVEFFTYLITNFDELVEKAQRIATIIAIVGAIVLAMKGLILVLTLVNLVMAANPVVLITLGIMALIVAVVLLVSWLSEVISKFDIIGAAKNLVPDFIRNRFDGEDGEDGRSGASGAPTMISKEERVARQIDEQRTTNTAELTIRDQTNRAELTGSTGPGVGVLLQPTGGFY